jgi:drug/metabolite transporter (DMT)-like permease
VTLQRSSLVKALWATLLFGSVPACIRVVHVDSYALGIWRLALAAAGMTALLMAQGRSAAAIASEVRRHWPVLTAVGICFGLHWLAYFQSIKIASASIGALGFSTCGVQLPLLGWLFGFGKPGWSAVGGVVLAMIGSFLCVPHTGPGDGLALGMAIGVLSGTLYAALPMLHQRHAHLDNELRTWAQFTFALPVFLLTAPAADWSPISTRDFWLIIHLGLIVNLIGHYLWVQVSTELPLSLTSALGYLQLPASLAFNYAFIGEQLTPEMLLGGGCIIAGNILALGTTKRPPIEPEPPIE